MSRWVVRRAVAVVVGLGTALAGALVGGPAQAAPASVPDSLFPSVGNPGYDVDAYGIRLTYRTDGTITARTTIVATSDGRLGSYTLDLEGLTIDAVSVDGVAARWRRSGHKVRVLPSAPVSGRFTTVIRYHGRPTTHTDPDGAADGWIPTSDGATVLSEPVGAMTWFPVNNVPSDKATFTVAVSAPNALAVAGNGTLTKQRSGDRTTWTWRQRQPMAPYLAMISIGRYHVYSSTMRLRSGRVIPTISFVDRGLSAAVQRRVTEARRLLPTIVRFEEYRFGAYPFDSVGIVVDRLDVGYALETQTRPVFDSDIDTSTLVHELAHQWFGDAVTPCDWGDIWLNEGFATYTESLWAATHGGPTLAEQFDDGYAQTDPDLWSPAPAALTDPADLFARPVYERGGLALQVIRDAIGTDAFYATLKAWVRTRSGGCVTTGQFLALAERTGDRSLDQIATDWLYTEGRPTGY